MILDLQRFLESARPVWKELEEALDHLENDPDPQWDLARTEGFYRLYQQTSAHLAEVRHLTAERELRGYLEQLVARSYARIYVRGTERSRGRWWQWFTAAFPAAVRRHAKALALSRFGFQRDSSASAATARCPPMSSAISPRASSAEVTTAS